MWDIHTVKNVLKISNFLQLGIWILQILVKCYRKGKLTYCCEHVFCHTWMHTTPLGTSQIGLCISYRTTEAPELARAHPSLYPR